ncbi:MAG: hypothetical protein JSR16_11460 [Proteobacteria bacterium]|nr:hypothetical protein [Pseudomonadota bacterium]MBS0302767.1 hypothetical protein [Pseudomonadota bacterium]
MHVFLVIVAGLMLLGVFTLLGWLWGASSMAVALAAKAFVPAWLLIAAANMWVGVTHAGYSVREELPILLIVFALPAALAAGVLWWLARGS